MLMLASKAVSVLYLRAIPKGFISAYVHLQVLQDERR